MTSNAILRLQTSWSVRSQEGRLELASVPRQKYLKLADRSGRLKKAITALAEGVPLQDAPQRLALSSALSIPQAERLIGDLEQAGVLVRREPDDDIQALDGSALYDRQIRFLSLFETATTSGLAMNRDLQNRKVVIPGLGGLGGWLALLCARIGIREIVGIDSDRIELSNLHRQILYSRSDIGRSKVEAAAERLRVADPEVNFKGHELWIKSPADLLPLLEGADLVVNGFPQFVPAFGNAANVVMEAALRAGVPSLNIPIATCVGPLTLPGVTACFHCAWEKLRSGFDYATQASPAMTKTGFLAAFAPRQAISGGIAIWEVLRFLSGMDRAPTLDGVLCLDIVSYQQHSFTPTPRNPECPYCGDAAISAHGTKSAGKRSDARAVMISASEPSVQQPETTVPIPGALDAILGRDDLYRISPRDAAAVRLEQIGAAVDHHRSLNACFDRYCQSRGLSERIEEAADLHRIPLLPSALFKRELDSIRTRPTFGPVLDTKSSGTLGSVSVIPRDDLTLMRFFSSAVIGQRDVLGIETSERNVFHLGPPALEAPSLWVAYVMAGVGVLYSTRDYVRDTRLDVLRLIEDLRNVQGSEGITVVGPPFLLMDLAKVLEERGPLALGPNALVMTIGGWKRRAGEKVPREEFDQRMVSALGLTDATCVRDTYNMVELNTVLFECAHRAMHSAPWLSVTARDPRTLDVLPAGERGLLAFLDPTPTSYPGFILSDDFGWVWRDVDCPCGITGDIVKVERRVKRVEMRGCALKLETAMQDPLGTFDGGVQ